MAVEFRLDRNFLIPTDTAVDLVGQYGRHDLVCRLTNLHLIFNTPQLKAADLSLAPLSKYIGHRSLVASNEIDLSEKPEVNSQKARKLKQISFKFSFNYLRQLTERIRYSSDYQSL